MTTMRTRLLGMAATSLLLLGTVGPCRVDLTSNSVYRHAKASALYAASHVELLAGNVQTAISLREQASRLVDAAW